MMIHHMPDGWGGFTLAIVVQQVAAECASNQRSDAEREEGKAHIGSLLSLGRKTRDVIIVGRRKRNLAKRDYDQRQDCAQRTGYGNQKNPARARRSARRRLSRPEQGL